VTTEEKKLLAVRLGEQAQELADPLGRNLVRLGTIVLQMRQDPQLPQLDGAKNFHEWRKMRLGKRWKTADRSSRIVETLLPILTEADILSIGQVKAFELTRLQPVDREKPEWIEKAKNYSTAKFKEAVKAYLENKPDHLEEMQTFTMRMTAGQKKSLQSDIAKAMVLYQTESKAVAFVTAMHEWASAGETEAAWQQAIDAGLIEDEAEALKVAEEDE
jgi:hypothetical protein